MVSSVDLERVEPSRRRAKGAAFDKEKKSSTKALSRIRSAVTYHVDKKGSFAQGPNTVVAHGAFARR
jgi:hypothetical protein